MKGVDTNMITNILISTARIGRYITLLSLFILSACSGGSNGGAQNQGQVIDEDEISEVENDNVNVVVSSPVNSTTIDFPEESTYHEYSPTEVVWSYETYEYRAKTGSYRVDERDKTGTISLSDLHGVNRNPLHWRDSTVHVLHSFAGPGLYPVLATKQEVLEAAKTGQPAAIVWVGAGGPMGTTSLTRILRYSTIYDPADSGSGSVAVSVDNEGRYRFNIGGLRLTPHVLSKPDDMQPDAPESITLSLTNGYVP